MAEIPHCHPMKTAPLRTWLPRVSQSLCAALNAVLCRLARGRRELLRNAAAVIISVWGVNAAQAGTTWDGGGADDNWGTSANWNPDGPPPVGSTVDLIFDGSTRLTPFNNYTAFDDFHSLTFAAGAGAFTVSGNSVDLFGKIENYSTNTQTLALSDIAINGGQPGTGEFNPVNGDLVISSANVFTNGNNVRVFGVNNKAVTFGAGTVISQSGGVVVEQASNVVLLGANTYTGGTTVNAGSLTIGNGGTAGAISGSSAVSVAGGAQMTWNNNNDTAGRTIANNLSGAGTVLFQGTNSVANQVFSHYALTGTNSGLTGTLKVSGARIQASSAAHLGSAAVDLQTGASAMLTGTNTFTNSFTIGNGAGWRDSGFYVGALRLEGSQTLNGNITLNNTTGIVLGDNSGANSAIGGWAAGTHALNGVISGPGDFAMSRFTSWNGGATQAVNITLGGNQSNTFTGKTVVDGQGGVASLILAKTGGAVAIAPNTAVQMGSGTGGQFNLRMGGSNQFGSGVVMNFVNASGQWGRFDLLDTNQTLAGMNAGTLTTQGGAVTQNGGLNVNTTAATATLTLNGSGTYLYNGYMRNVDTGGTGKLALVKAGTGTQTLAGNQITYNGDTTINSGTLVLADTTAFGSAITVNAGGTLTANRTALGGGARSAIMANGVNLAGGTLNIDNAGSGLAGGWTTFTAANGLTGTGTINVNSGVFSRDNTFANVINTSATVNVAAGAFFGAGRGGNSTIGALNGAGIVSTLWAGANQGSITIGNGDGTGVFTGTVSGDGSNGADLTQQGGILSVIKVGTGTQTFSGAASSYKGGTTVNGGTLVLDNTPLIGTLGGTGAWTIAGGANLTVSTSNVAVDNWVTQAALTGTGTLTKEGTGWFQFRGGVPANFAGSIVINNGRFGNGFNSTVWTNSTADVFVGATGELDLRTDDMRVDELTGSGTVINTFALGEANNTLTVGSNNGSSQFDGVIRGIGGVGANNTSIDVGRNSLAKIGTGTFTLTGANVYGGTTTASEGTLRIAGGDNRLPVGTALTVNGGATSGGTFDLNARSQTVAALSGGSGAVTGTVTNTATGTGTINVTGTSTYDGVIQDGGAGKLTALTKSGVGTLALTGTNTQSGQTLITGGALRQGSAGALSPNSNVNMNGGIVELGVTDFTAALGTGNGQMQFTGSGGFGAFGGTRVADIGGAAATMTWGTGNFVPDGSNLILSGPNSDSTIRFLNPIDLNGGSRRITSLGGTAAVDAEIAGNITNGSLALVPGGSLFQITGQITAPVVVENGSGAYGVPQVVLQRAGGNAVTGALQIGHLPLAAPASAAGLALGLPDQIADTTVVTFGAAQGRWSYFNMQGNSETIAGLSNLAGMDGGVVQVVESEASPGTNSTLTLNVTSGTQSYFGHIRDRSSGWTNNGGGTGRLNFVKTGAGTQELATWNNQTWSGTTDVQQGTLRLVLNNGANLPGALSVSSGGTLEFSPAGTNNQNITGALSGTGDLVKTGTGTTSLWNGVSLTGSITVSEGRLRNDGNSANWSSNSANLTVTAAGIFDLRADSARVNELNGDGLITNSYGNGIGVHDTLTVGVANGGGVFSGTITDGGSGSGDGLGGNAFTKEGTGTQILSGNNTYTGITTISGGVLQIGSGGTSGTLGTGTVTNNATLAYDRSDAVTVANNITGTGNLSQQGDGTLTLSGTNSLGGVVTALSGTLSITGQTTFGSMNIANGATLGGNGTLTSAGGDVILASGSHLAPGTSPGVLTVDLTGGTFDISGAVTPAASAALVFELGNPDSDGVLLNNTFLNIGNGVLGFDDFVFSAAAGFGEGTYVLFNGTSPITGSLAGNLSGAVAGSYLGTLGTADGGNDLVLTVVPEPGSAVLLVSGLALITRRRRR